MALKQIKSKIKSTERTSKVTKAMEAVSAVKMRKSQERALKGRPYAEAALRILENVSRSPEVQAHPFFQEGVGTHDCIIVVTSDKGLAGSLNSSVLKEATRVLKNEAGRPVELICFGKKAYEHFTRRGHTIPRHYVNISDDIAIADTKEVVAYIVERFKSGVYRHVNIVYQNFISTFEQSAIDRQILPIKHEEIRTMIVDILPRHGKYSEQSMYIGSPTYLTEQNQTEVFNLLLNSIIEIMLYHALLESKASEHSARMVAMKNATDKARDVTKLLTRQYNKARQTVITREVSEITGGIEAMKNT